MRNACCGIARATEEQRAGVFGEQCAILDGVIEVELVHPVEALPLFELVHINGQRRAVFPGACAAGGAFELDTDILVDSPVILDDGAMDVGALGLLEALDFARRQLNA